MLHTVSGGGGGGGGGRGNRNIATSAVYHGIRLSTGQYGCRYRRDDWNAFGGVIT